MSYARIDFKNDTRTFDRITQFDEKSRKYPIRTLVPTKPRSFTWRCDIWLDQGHQGACVGFGWSHELAAKPKPIPVTQSSAQSLYKAAQAVDDTPGEDYNGTSVLAGAKAVQATGYMKEYRWAFGLQDLILAVGHAGPAVLGLNWYDSMFDPDDKGFLVPDQNLAGGHCIIANGVNIKGEYFTLHNSWGKDWGTNGEAKIKFADMDRLLKEEGEACIPVVRVLHPKPV